MQEISRLKSAGEKVRTFHVKCEAAKKAKCEARAKYIDIWSDVESTYKTHETTKATHPTYIVPPENLDNNESTCHQDKGATPLITIIHLLTPYKSDNPTNPKQLIDALVDTLNKEMNYLTDRCTLKDAVGLIRDLRSEHEVQVYILYL